MARRAAPVCPRICGTGQDRDHGIAAHLALWAPPKAWRKGRAVVAGLWSSLQRRRGQGCLFRRSFANLSRPSAHPACGLHRSVVGKTDRPQEHRQPQWLGQLAIYIVAAVCPLASRHASFARPLWLAGGAVGGAGRRHRHRRHDTLAEPLPATVADRCGPRPCRLAVGEPFVGA